MKKIKTVSTLLLLSIAIASCGGKKTSKEDQTKDTVKTDSTTIVAVNTDSVSRNSTDFPTFIKYFLNTCYYNNNIDSLMYNSSATIVDFMNEEAGFARYWNRGAFCNLFTKAPYDLPFSEKYNGETCTFKDLSLFNKKPVEGFCEESKDSNGVYYYTVTQFPDAWDMNKDKAVKTKLPSKFDQVSKMKVDILFDGYYAKQFYFAQIDTIWYLVFIDDCDCSV